MPNYIIVTHDDNIINVKGWEKASALVSITKMLLTVEDDKVHSIRTPIPSKVISDTEDDYYNPVYVDGLVLEHHSLKETKILTII